MLIEFKFLMLCYMYASIRYATQLIMTAQKLYNWQNTYIMLI